MPINLVLVEDHNLLRAGLKELLSKDPNLRVVGEAGTLHEAAKVLKLTPCDVVIMDLELPDGNSFGLIRSLSTEAVCHVLVLSMHAEPGRVSQCLQAGATGYMVKTAHPDDMIDAIKAVHSGHLYLHKSVSKAASAGIFDKASRTLLTDREETVLRLLVSGKTNEAIGKEVGVSVTRVKFHIRSLFTRFGVEDRASLVREASAAGLIGASSVPPKPR